MGINPTRDGILRVLKSMGGNIELLNRRENAGEPVADLLAVTFTVILFSIQFKKALEKA